MFRVERHVWRTADGRLVEHGHPDAAVLAYAAGQDVPDAEAERSGLKAMRKPLDKARARAADKGSVVAIKSEGVSRG